MRAGSAGEEDDVQLLPGTIDHYVKALSERQSSDRSSNTPERRDDFHKASKEVIYIPLSSHSLDTNDTPRAVVIT